MYEAFFGLHTEPFSIAPDPRFLYMSDKHREALGLLAHGLQRGSSFTLLSGEIGAGKTTVWRRFLEQLPPNVDVANVVNPRLDVTALLSRVCEDLRVPLPEAGRPVDLIDALHGHLLLAQASGRRTLIVIDEAQALSDDVLEQLRLLTNLDSTGKKLQVMLIAQPEMREILERPELEPLAQRVVMRYHLPALDESETAGYIAHRLTVAGYNGPLPFEAEALVLIHRLCRGVPRRINVLCDVCLIGANAAGLRRVGKSLVVESAAKVFGVRPKLPAPSPPDPRAPEPGPQPAPQPAPEPASEAPPAHAPAPAAAPAAAAAPAPEPAGPGPSRTLVTAGALLAAMAAGAWLGPKLMLPGTPPAVSAGAPAPVAAAAQPEAPPPAVAVPAVAVPAVAVPAVPVPAVPALSDRLFTAAQADEGAAFQALARLWKAEIPAADACSAAASQGLECYRARGGLALLRQLDRPGLLRLVDERGRVAHVLLQGLDGDMALLAIGGSVQRVPLAELGRWWRGEFATLWRVPPGWRAGEGGGAPAAWLAQHLAVVDGQRAASGAAAESLRARIMAFQVTRGLVPDGLAGPLTLMLLNAASGVDEPHLGAGGALTIGNRPS